MGSIFRSRDMAFCEVFFQSETAFNCVAALGELGTVQFNDTNALTTVQKPKFLPEIRRCDEMERKLQFIEKEIKSERVAMSDRIENPPVLQPREITKLENKLDELQSKLTEMDADLSSMEACHLELIERLLALEMTAPYLTDINLGHFQTNFSNEPAPPANYHTTPAPNTNYHRRPMSSPSPTQNETGTTMSHLNFLVGVITRERVSAFERMVWRMAGNNVYVRTFTVSNDLKDPKTGAKLLLNVFIAIFEGEMLREKIQRICKAFHATIYPCPDHPDDRQALCEDLKPRISELATVLKEATGLRHQLLIEAARDLRTWAVQLRKVKSVYYMMNMLNLDVTKRYFIGHCWVPCEELKRVEDALRDATKSSAGELLVPFIINQILPASTNDVPTYFPTNKFTSGFQAIVDAFSAARYHEVNPALYTVITFPFLFSVMFSDAGHGIVLLIFALWLILKEPSLKNTAERHETFGMILSGRYIILLMGLFSLYSGLMFNEFFGKSVNLFQSRWHSNFTNDYLLKNREYVGLEPKNRENVDLLPHPIGLDPIWYVASNRIIFTNSLKMKLSVIFGVVHMFFGIVLSLGNHLYFRHYANIICEFIPQILLISSMFVYMDILIVYKWIVFSADNSAQAPSLLLGMINMFMLQYPNETEADRFVNKHLKMLQMILVCICAICIPWLLLAKPLYLLKKSKRPITCREMGGGNHLVSPNDSTPIPVLSRSGVLSPTSRPFPPPTMEVIELAEVRKHSPREPYPSTSYGTGNNNVKSAVLSPVMKFSTLFASENMLAEAGSDHSSIKSSGHGNYHKAKSTPTLTTGKPTSEVLPVALNVYHEHFLPVSPQQVPQIQISETPAKLGKGGAAITRSYSPFPPAPGYREKLDESVSKKDEPQGDVFDFGEIFMLQVIHTIEYVLGLVSHTASYLRLWALSLAHAELSETFWMMILRGGIVSAAGDAKFGYIYIAITFLIWTCLTFAVLIFMESLSAFLHALRLHWVEFQSKFYIGNGRLFEPFSFKKFQRQLSSSLATE